MKTAILLIILTMSSSSLGFAAFDLDAVMDDTVKATIDAEDTADWRAFKQRELIGCRWLLNPKVDIKNIRRWDGLSQEIKGSHDTLQIRLEENDKLIATTVGSFQMVTQNVYKADQAALQLTSTLSYSAIIQSMIRYLEPNPGMAILLKAAVLEVKVLIPHGIQRVNGGHMDITRGIPQELMGRFSSEDVFVSSLIGGDFHPVQDRQGKEVRTNSNSMLAAAGPTVYNITLPADDFSMVGGLAFGLFNDRAIMEGYLQGKQRDFQFYTPQKKQLIIALLTGDFAAIDHLLGDPTIKEIADNLSFQCKHK